MPNRAQLLGDPWLLPGQTTAIIDPATVPKYVTPLYVLPAMPRSSGPGRDEYSVAARRFRQQVLPPGFPRTTVFGLGAPNPGTDHAPGYTIESTVGRETRVTWRNELMTAAGEFVPPLLNPSGGPVPLVVHHHGARVTQESDGYPEAWMLAPARDLPPGHAEAGSRYQQFRAEAAELHGVDWLPGTQTSVYPNRQPAGTGWYHDHSLGVSRANVYSGLAGFWLRRGGVFDLPAGVLPGPAPMPGDRPGRRYYEIALMLQDKSFNVDGSLCEPVFFANCVTVNGHTWPFLEVEPRRYRFRLLSAADVRTFVLKIVANPLAARPAQAALPIWVIGSDGGYLPAPVAVESLPMATGERYDVIVDFTGLRPGTELYLSNESGLADPATTGQVMRFRVVPLASVDPSVPPEELGLPGSPAIGTPTVVRTVSPGSARWHDPVTETPALGSTETWEIHNFNRIGYAFHVHLVRFQILDRRAPGGGRPVSPRPYETGPKDVVLVPPGITRFTARFDVRGRYVWHCHFPDHEDNGIMRPWEVV